MKTLKHLVGSGFCVLAELFFIAAAAAYVTGRWFKTNEQDKVNERP